MIVVAVVCPGPPFLVPGLAPRLARAVPDLPAASRNSVRLLAGADRVLVLTTGRRGVGTVVRPPGSAIAAGSLARSDLAIAPDAVLPGGEPRADPAVADRVGGGSTVVPAVGTIVAAHLLMAAGITSPTTAVEIDPVGEDAAAQVRAAVPDLEGPTTTGLLVIADGAASHGPSAPGAEDPASAVFDAELGARLAAGDPAGLAAFCRDRHQQAAALRCETLPAFAALAGLTAEHPPEDATIDYYGAPFGVGYLVASWQWHSIA